MLKTAHRPLTVQDFRELPEGPPFYQLIEGDLHMSPSPNRFYQEVLGTLYHLLRLHLETHPIGSVHQAPSDVVLSDLNVCEPDLYFVAKDRQSILTKQRAHGAPNLVIEILSPRTAKLDKGVKKEVYARAGVEELWLVDPDRNEIQIFRLAQSTETPTSTFRGRQRLVSPTFPGLQILISKVFP